MSIDKNSDDTNSNTKARQSADCGSAIKSRESANMVYRLTSWLLALPRYSKRAILILCDYLAATLCLFFALALRYGSVEAHISLSLLGGFAAIPVAGLYLIGFYKGIARIFLDGEMRRVMMLFVGLLVIFAISYYFGDLQQLPRSVPALFLFLLLIWLWSSRLVLRELLSRWQGKPARGNRHTGPGDKVIIYGAGAAGKALFEALQPTRRYQVVAFVDDDSGLNGAYLCHKKIFSATKLLSLVTKFDVAQVFLAVPDMSRSRQQQIIESLSNISVKIKQLPSLTEIADGKVTVNTLRKVDILDVLNRQSVMPDERLLQDNILGKGVLVTGAGGSIGSDLCRQILKNQPRCLVLFELSEYALYTIHQELLAQQSGRAPTERSDIIAIIGNVTNEHKLRSLLAQYHIQTLYHAAAYKHVPLVEHNPFEGVINNAKGTYHCARAAMDAQVETFVLISTDKAVRPTNIMGASKRLAELVCQALSQEMSPATSHTPLKTSIKTPIKISMVRFGNVLGSSGSVVPLFTRQIEQGGPITVTHPEVTRYFMTIPEAANLVIQAGAMATGGEVFVLDMGDPVKIVDLARRMVHLSGCVVKDADHPHGDIEIVFSGLRPGEKLYEELIIGDDNIEDTHHPLIKQAREHSFPLSDIEATLIELPNKARQGDIHWLKQQFKLFVVGYQA